MATQRMNQARLKLERMSKTRQVLNDLDLDAILITTWDNIRYATGMRTVISPEWCCLLTVIISRDGQIGVFGPFREENGFEIGDEADEWSVFPIGENSIAPEKWARKYSRLLSRHGAERGARIGIDFMSFQIFHHLQKELPSCTFVDVFAAMLAQRAVKSNEEIKALSISARIVDEGIAAALDQMTDGERESGIYSRAVSRMIELGSEGEPFYQMLSSGKRSIDHIFPSKKKIRHGESLMIDIGCFANGYAGDITRTGYCGRRSDRRFKELYSSFYEGYREGMGLIRAGKRTPDIDSELRSIFHECGCPASPIALGHGIGMRCIELPSFTTSDGETRYDAMDTLKPGMVIAFEPKTTAKKIGTLGLEDMILVTEAGMTKLTNSPYLV